MTAGESSTILRFLFVGTALALVYALLAALATTHLPLPQALSAGLAWIVCIPLGFWCHRKFTFTEGRQHPHALGLYAATQVIGIAISAGVSFLFAQGHFWPDLCVHLSASALAAAVSYAINRTFTFPRAIP